MKPFIPLMLLLLSFRLLAQNTESVSPGQPTWLSKNAHLSFPTGTISGSTVNDLVLNTEAYLKNNLSDLKNPNTALILTQNTASPYARYLTFKQSFMGTEIFGTSIKIGIDNQNKILSLISKTLPVNTWPANISIPEPESSKINTAIGNCDHFDISKIWFYSEETCIPAYYVKCLKMDGTRNDEVVLDRQYDIVYESSLIQHYRYPDSLVTMYVFYPDPLTSAHSKYKPPFSTYSLWNPFPNTNNDSNSKALDSQMIPKQIRVSILNRDSFILENQYVIEKDLGPPYYTEFTFSKTPVFHFNRDSSAFRDLQIYYYINSWRSHLSDMGYDSLGNTQLTVDPSGEEDDDSQFYPPTSSTPGIIYFGMGGEPDAEDADVPTHEYTHFLSYCACNNCAHYGTERQALDEGTADYFAASNSKAIDTFGWRKVYNWDGNNDASSPPWNGRSCAVHNIYPGALDTFNYEIHACGQLWSSALMQIWDVIGRTKTDRIMLETLYSMAGNILMSDAAKLYLKSDSLLYNYADKHTITNYFVQRGFLPESAAISPAVNSQVWYKINTNYFSSANQVYLDFGIPQSGTFALYDMTGKLIREINVSNALHVEFNAPAIANGIYILGVNTGGLQKSFKLLK